MGTYKLKVMSKDGAATVRNEFFVANQANLPKVGVASSDLESKYSKVDTFGRKIANLKSDTYVDTTIEISLSMAEELG